MERGMSSIGIIILVAIIIIGLGIGYYVVFYNDEEQLIGGCAGVSLDNLQECCDNWAAENSVIKIQCIGEWEIINKQCSWKCLTG